MPVSYIVVADSANARIFSTKKTGAKWDEIADLTHAEGRMSGAQLGSDKPGRSQDSRGSNRHAMEPQQDRKRKESGVFARQLADYLKQNETGFDHLILVCPPRFLGLLRKLLDKPCREKLGKEIAIDIVHDRIDKIRTLILEKLP